MALRVSTIGAVAAGRVCRLEFEEILGDDQIAARGLMSMLEIEDLDRPVQIPALSFVANGKATTATRVPSPLSADTKEVLGGLVYDEVTIKGLRKARTI